MKKNVLVVCLLLCMGFLFSSCDVKVTSPTPATGYVEFLNTVEQAIVGGTVQYSIRMLSGLGQTWPAEVAYGSKTILKAVTPYSGDFNLTGEIKAPGGTWAAGDWDLTAAVAAGDTVTITLTF